MIRLYKMNDSKILVRLPSFTPAEEHFLLTLVKENANVIESKSINSSDWLRKREAWDKIHSQFARRFGLKRGSKNLREKYVALEMERKKKMDKVAEMIGLTTDSKSSADSDVINICEVLNIDEVINIDDDADQNCSIENGRLQDTEFGENENSNKWFYSSSEKSIPNENVISHSPSCVRTNKESSTITEHLFWEKQELRATEKHRWDEERHKLELERHQWELERHKWKLKEHKLKEHILEQELKYLPLRVSSTIAAGDAITPAEKDGLPKNSQTSQENMGKTNSNLVLDTTFALLPQIKEEPTLDIIDTAANYCSTTCYESPTPTNATEVHKRLGGNVSADEYCAFKKLKSTQQMVSEEHGRLEKRALNNDILEMVGTECSYYDILHLINEVDSDNGHNEDDEVETEEAQDEREFLQLLTKYKLKNYAFKLKELNIGLDCLKSITEVDIKDIFGCDIGARIRFRGLVDDCRPANTNFSTTSGYQMRLNETATKREHKRRFSLKKATDEEIKSGSAVKESNEVPRKELLPKTPYQTVTDFKAFEESLNNSEDAYTSLVDELVAQQFQNPITFVKSIWRRIMTDNVAENFSWNGTSEKTAIRTLSVTNALRVAYLHKYPYVSNEEFQRTNISFFQRAKSRRLVRENYEKYKASLSLQN